MSEHKERHEAEEAVEEDGWEHLHEPLEDNAELRQIWEERRARRKLGMLVLRRRLELGFSQRELAAKMGITLTRRSTSWSG